MLRIGQRVAMSDIELLIVDIMQKLIDAAQVVVVVVDFLPVKSLLLVLLPKHFGECPQQLPGAAVRVVHDWLEPGAVLMNLRSVSLRTFRIKALEHARLILGRLPPCKVYLFLTV